MTYHTKEFSVPALTGLSQQSVDEHLKLYAGYVKHANLILEKLAAFGTDEATTYERGELQRRFSFEYNGIRNHELYFSQIEHGAAPLATESPLHAAIAAQFGSYENFIQKYTALALTRGIGWAMMYHDAQTDALTLGWVDEQHLGHLVGLTPIFALDMWEHSFVFDYQPSGKKKYVEDYFANVNWSVVSDRYSAAKNATK